MEYHSPLLHELNVSCVFVDGAILNTVTLHNPHFFVNRPVVDLTEHVLQPSPCFWLVGVQVGLRAVTTVIDKEEDVLLSQAITNNTRQLDNLEKENQSA